MFPRLKGMKFPPVLQGNRILPGEAVRCSVPADGERSNLFCSGPPVDVDRQAAAKPFDCQDVDVPASMPPDGDGLGQFWGPTAGKFRYPRPGLRKDSASFVPREYYT